MQGIVLRLWRAFCDSDEIRPAFDRVGSKDIAEGIPERRVRADEPYPESCPLAVIEPRHAHDACRVAHHAVCPIEGGELPLRAREDRGSCWLTEKPVIVPACARLDGDRGWQRERTRARTVAVDEERTDSNHLLQETPPAAKWIDRDGNASAVAVQAGEGRCVVAKRPAERSRETGVLPGTVVEGLKEHRRTPAVVAREGGNKQHGFVDVWGGHVCTCSSRAMLRTEESRKCAR
jgi:hypothetical protein